MATAEYRKVKLKDVVVSEPIRTDLGKVDELAGSLKEHGLLEPIVVRPEGDRLVLVAGQRRIAAARKLGWEDIDAHVVEMGAEEAKVRQLAENVHRKDLNPLERARAIGAYVAIRQKQDPALTYEAIGKELQISQPEVSNTLLLLRQEVHVQKLVEDGQLTPGHIEHAVAPLAARAAKLHEEILGKPADEKELQAAVSKIAHQWAREKLDIRTAKAEAEDALAQYKGELAKTKLAELVRGAKRKTCPGTPHSYSGPEATAYKEVGGRLILLCRMGDSAYNPEPGHSWDAETGELYYTPSQLKAAKDAAAAATRARKAKKKSAPREKVERDFAVFYSRATIEQWAHGRLDAIDKELEELGFDDHSLTAAGKGGGGMDDYTVEPTGVPDGKGGMFATRVEIAGFTSLSNGADYVAEDTAAKDLRKQRGELLEFQRKVLKVKQADDDLWPVEVSGFTLGEKVRIGDKSNIASYVGKQGAILAFVDRFYGRGVYGGRSKPGGAMYAVLDMGASTKLHAVAALEKLVSRRCATCGGKLVEKDLEGKKARICAGCGKGEGPCDCAPKKKSAKTGAKA